jgi:hypothetical protein
VTNTSTGLQHPSALPVRPSRAQNSRIKFVYELSIVCSLLHKRSSVFHLRFFGKSAALHEGVLSARVRPSYISLLGLRFCDLVSISATITRWPHASRRPSSLASTINYLQVCRGTRVHKLVGLHLRPYSTPPDFDSYEVFLYKYPTVCAMERKAVCTSTARILPSSLSVLQASEPCNVALYPSTDKAFDSLLWRPNGGFGLLSGLTRVPRSTYSTARTKTAM